VVVATKPQTADMVLRLVSSGDDRALAIRDHILPLLREYGASKFNVTPSG
jgi:hypothetical protein